MAAGKIFERNRSALETSPERSDVKSDPFSALLKEEDEFRADEHSNKGEISLVEFCQPFQSTVRAETSSDNVISKHEIDPGSSDTQPYDLFLRKGEEIVDNKIVTYELVGNDNESATKSENTIDYDEVDLMNLFEDVDDKNTDKTIENEKLSLVISESGELIGIEADGVLQHSDDMTPATRPNQRKTVTGTSYNRPYSCGHCPRRFRYSSELKQHSKDHLTKILFSCDHCFASFKSKIKLRSHLKKNHSSSKKFSCDQCPQQFKHAWSLKRHLCLHSKKDVFSCDKCPAKYSQKRSLEVHHKTHSDIQYFCPQCPQKFSVASSLRRHLIVHDDKKAFVCDFCSAKFWQRDHLNKHLMMHKGERPFTCAHCPSKFSRKSNLSRHIKDVHFTAQKYSCQQCSRSFTHLSSLKRHSEKHNKGYPYACIYCSMKFKEKRPLTNHIAAHLRDKSFSCEHCSAKFSHKKKLRIHLSTHCNNPYNASLKFDCSDEYRRHVHAEPEKFRKNKRFFCTLCPASFTQNRMLKTHIAKHSESK